MSKHILMIVTSHDQINATRKTGLWFEEFAEPYRVFQEQGYQVTVASPKGGVAPIDPNSLPETPDETLMAVIQATTRLETLQPADYDAVFLPGGHGTMFDLPDDRVGRVIGLFADAGKVIGAVCHGPAGLVGARLANGTPIVQGYRLTSFTNEEEAAAHLVDEMPFLLQTRLVELGASFEGAPMWQDHVVVDRRLVTGQNPQSSLRTAQAVVGLLERIPDQESMR
ncbi:MAG: type 1 glutamine amidotransferase domain-containing protein [Anaerolineae bacterium]|jgi:putative intracellular protease/amidase|nr:type 1 glutamine amidotransferase domain-containing protein [Anaerolineae bacterium]